MFRAGPASWSGVALERGAERSAQEKKYDWHTLRQARPAGRPASPPNQPQVRLSQPIVSAPRPLRGLVWDIICAPGLKNRVATGPICRKAGRALSMALLHGRPVARVLSQDFWVDFPVTNHHHPSCPASSSRKYVSPRSCSWLSLRHALTTTATKATTASTVAKVRAQAQTNVARASVTTTARATTAITAHRQ
jgi:hypothetical protein